MKNDNLYVDIHVLQNVPPSCINRDDTGSPKTAKYGGVTRARVSSQAWKHEIRKMFKEIFDEDELGIRTKRVPWLIAKEIQKLDSSKSEEEAVKTAIKALTTMGIKTEEDKSSVLMFFSKGQAKALAEAALSDSKGKKEYAAAIKSAPSVDIALFGRMVAADASMNYDAACQVAHAISTHGVHNEYDYFTACDDLNNEDETGAGHLGTVEFNSSTLYRYATVNVIELVKTLGELTGETVKGFTEAFIRSMPTGKQNTFANRTMPDFVCITLRSDQPVNLCGAFEKPVSVKGGGYLEESERRFNDYAEEIYKKYSAPQKTWTFENGNIADILNDLAETVKEKLSESEGK